jgi:hypothetical protein
MERIISLIAKIAVRREAKFQVQYYAAWPQI